MNDLNNKIKSEVLQAFSITETVASSHFDDIESLVKTYSVDRPSNGKKSEPTLALVTRENHYEGEQQEEDQEQQEQKVQEQEQRPEANIQSKNYHQHKISSKH
ncbi:hypothetical protein PPL_12159 [Heterostelium album PN500]|uniref:Uncharacterized protein n=1 Tax=Heterostelium pallidum (strain ATCC 26659 / Pp 5 / PN500) TaxID=670386 RepID=D3BLV5_HETP5|nr:hypothetical protein PPL_12159 [Heterostelium album PN500]EFA77556.1 hypothetical protein PPL_12159 [Heterostelium album PN500]|eukprot:XP_020429684.1 hypothetical protein PPL_12159 [Heterostelium album PN500]